MSLNLTIMSAFFDNIFPWMIPQIFWCSPLLHRLWKLKYLNYFLSRVYCCWTSQLWRKRNLHTKRHANTYHILTSVNGPEITLTSPNIVIELSPKKKNPRRKDIAILHWTLVGRSISSHPYPQIELMRVINKCNFLDPYSSIMQRRPGWEIDYCQPLSFQMKKRVLKLSFRYEH